ncbi:MAG: C45 family autoproteolytic acyltransferase/hydrolase [Candidatus Limnocylindria bacterium]
MRLLHLAGDHHAMGRQHAKQARQARSALERVVEARLGEWHERRADLAKSYVGAVRRYAPATARMLDGIADGFGIDAARLWAYTASGWVDEQMGRGNAALAGEGCTAWAVAGSAGKRGEVILAKNRDYYRDHRELQVVCDAAPARGHRWFAVGSLGSPGVFSSGMNERGLCVADTHVSTRDLGPGIPRYAQMLEVLERCETVREAVRLIGSAPATGGGTLVLADSSGDLAVCELTHSGVLVLPHADAVVATNHFSSPALRRRNVQRADHRPSLRRRARVVAAVRSDGPVGVEQAEALMARHGTEESAVCRHAYPGRAGRYGTISSVVYLPARHEVHLADGWPCTAPFQRFVAGTDFWM